MAASFSSSLAQRAAEVQLPTIPPLEYPITDPSALRSAFLAHREYIDSCVAGYSAAGVANAADYIELCCARHADRPALEHVRLPLQATASLPVAASSEQPTPQPAAQLRFSDEPPSVISYAQLDRMAGRMACLWLARGLDGPSAGAAAAEGNAAAAPSTHHQAGNATDGVVGLLMENCPFYVCAWLSFSKLGRTVALLSTALKAPQMRHSIDIARVRTVLVSEKYRGLWEETRKLYENDGVEPPMVYWSRGADVDLEPMRAFDAALGLDGASSSSGAVPSSDDMTLPAPDAPIESALCVPRLAREASSFDFASLRRARRVGPESPLFYIYTSGTTGPSKAAIFSHRRFMGAGVTWAWPMELSSEDRYLVVLPLFHGNGGVVALSACMHVGAVALIREKFSVTTFWRDVATHRATAMIYVGELWRYLHNAARAAIKQAEQQRAASSSQAASSTPLAFNTTLRVIAGNGLRSDIWEDVCALFARPALAGGAPRPLKVVEHYGMTEMPSGPYLNFYGRVGSCGFIPPDVRAKQQADKLVLFDLDSGAVVRRVTPESRAAGLGEEGGLVELTEPNQVGEALFLLAPGVVPGASQQDNPHTERGAVDADDATALTDPLGNPLYLPYRNYTDASACARRVYRNAFAPLDAWFATGDLLSLSPEGFFTFADRAGDSYRWKGHNVVSNEVAEVLAQFAPAHMQEVNVYGVEWKAEGEGRVGMACVVWREGEEEEHAAAAGAPSNSSPQLPPSLDPVALLAHLRSSLPSHAVPAFIRVKRAGAAAGSSSGAESASSVAASAGGASTGNALTSTFKFQKHLMARDGFDPAKLAQQGDVLLWWPQARGRTSHLSLSSPSPSPLPNSTTEGQALKELQQQQQAPHQLQYEVLTEEVYRLITTVAGQ